MANYVFEEMTDADAEAFTSSDTLRFSSASATPANVSVSNTGLDITFVTSGSKTLAFQGAALDGAEILFTSSFIAGTDTSLFLGNIDGDSISVGNGDGGNYAYGFAGDDSILGGAGADVISGAAGNDEIDGAAGHDDIFGGAGDDELRGGDGNDHLYGFGLTGAVSTDGADDIDAGAGSDYIQGNAGDDTLDGGDGSDRINGGGDNDLIFGSAGNDTVNGNKGDDSISGGDGNDSLRGGADNDAIAGNAGNDVILGDLGDDELSGGDGVDLLNGGDGDDVISGGAGFDALTGGAGDDVFVFDTAEATIDTPDFEAVDTVTDFTTGEDLVDLGFTVAVTDSPTDVIFLTFEAAATYAAGQTLAAGEALSLSVGDDTYLFYEDGGLLATADSVILFAGVAALTDDDFVVAV